MSQTGSQPLLDVGDDIEPDSPASGQDELDGARSIVDAEDRPQCQEPGCNRLCRKVPRLGGYYDFCPEHNRVNGVTRSGGQPAGGAQRAPKEPASRKPTQLAANRQKTAAHIENNVTGWLAMIQAGLLVSGDQFCAWAVGEEGPAIAKAVGDVAAENPWLVKRLDAVDKWGALSVLVFHLAKLGLMVGVHHQLIPWDGPIKFLVPNPFPPQAPAPPPPTTPSAAAPHVHEPAPAPHFQPQESFA